MATAKDTTINVLVNTESRLERRQRLGSALHAFHKEHEANWTPEVEANWVALNEDYDENYAALKAEHDEAEKGKARNDRLAALEAHSRTPLSNRLIGRDGATVLDAAPTVNLQQRQFVALAGWIKAASRKMLPTEDEILASKQVGQPLNSPEFEIRMLPTHDFRNLQRSGGYYGGRYMNVLQTSPGVSGGFAVGETFLSQLELAMLYYGPMLQSSDIIRTASGEPLHWPTGNDTMNTGVILPEIAPVVTADPTFGRVSWGAFKFSSKEILVSFELLQDSLFSLEPVLAEMLGIRLGRIQNTKFTTGVGGIEPTGIVTAASLGATTAAANAITFDELINLEHSIDISRRGGNGTGYMFHDNILLALRKLKDLEGRYFWQAGNAPPGASGANTGVPDSLNTWPYWINNDMASTIATTNKTILFGQLRQYKIRRVGSMRMIRLNELHAENDEVAFLAFDRADGNLLNAGDNPVKYLQQA